jgi:hypothetical protein
MKIRATSIESYSKLKDKGVDVTDQERVYVVIKLMPDSTDSEIAFMLGHQDPNKVRPRRFELMREGYVESTIKKRCNITGRNALAWRVVKKC